MERQWTAVVSVGLVRFQWCLCGIMLMVSPISAAELLLRWTTPASADAYHLYDGSRAGQYTRRIDISAGATIVANNLMYYHRSDIVTGRDYFLAVTASNSAGESDFSNEKWLSSAAITRTPPTANAGPDRNGMVGATMSLGVSPLAGVTYAWFQVSGPPVVLPNPTVSIATFKPLVLGTYTFVLVAADSGGVASSDEVTVTVTNGPSTPTPTRTTGSATATVTRTATRSPTRIATPTRPARSATPTRTRTPTRSPTPTLTPGRTPTSTPGGGGPQTVPNLVLWLDASQLRLNDRAQVASWGDASGKGHTATQSSAANRPAYRTNVLNGKPAVRFDGSDYLRIAGSVVTGAQARTVFFVARPNAAGNIGIIDLGNGATTRAGFLITPEFGVRINGGSRLWLTAASTSVATIGVVQLSGSTTRELTAWANGTQLAAGSTIAAAVKTAGSGTVGAWTAAPLSATTFEGDIAEIIVYKRALLDAERRSVEQYLANKYGISRE